MLFSHKPRWSVIAVAVVVIVGWGAAIGVSVASAEEPIEYNRDIRPILTDTCFACHGPDSAARKADLRLDQREAAIEMAAITPGEPDDSEMIRRILSDDPHEVMPPPATKKKLTDAQKQKLVRWVREGAEYQLHWSFIPPQRPDPPAVKNTSWVRNPIDNFIAARLERAGLKPNPEADRRTLARRVSLDLTGLPPDPKLVEAFVADSSPNAYEKLVDKLLGSKHWGEHRGRYWLDYARYADTHGIHFDNFREMWTYREWVIDAFNQNMPYDQFTITNLAGDLLPNRTLEQQIGSGFNRCNMTTNEGGIIDEEYLVLYTRDRTETTSLVWMGLTAGCAVCHSHKFDPLSQREFYEMAAFFNNTVQRAKDGNVKDTPPIVVVPLDDDRQRWDELGPLIEQAKQQVAGRRKEARSDFNTWLESATVDTLRATVPQTDMHLHAALDEGEGKTVHIAVDEAPREVTLTDAAEWQPGVSGQALKTQGVACELADAGDFEKDQPFTCTAWIHVPANDGGGALCARMDNASAYRGWDFWMQRRQVGMHVIDAWPDQGLKVVGRAQVPANKWVHVAVSYDGSGKAAGVKIYYDGKPQQTNVENDKLPASGSIKTEVPFKIGQRNGGDPFTGGLQDLRIYKRVLSQSEVESLSQLTRFGGILAKAPDQRSDKETNELYDFWLGAIDDEFQSRTAHQAGLEREQNAIQTRGTIAHVMQDKNEPATAYVLFRGEYDQRRDQVSANTPAVLPPFPEDYPRNRLGFAKWLLLPEHPLTARVTVNRYWQEVFGTGIVGTSEDFGVSGELPSHSELLDWLALEFRDSGWDVKKLFKLMVMSAAYRQSAAVTPEKLELDPDNRLLARGPRFRMDAEMVRDYALAASGLLVSKLGGPSVKPYQPPGVWEAIAMNVSNTRSYERDTGESLYRRSLYTFVQRMAPPASMDIFNAPNREFCVVRRERTNTPLQALVTLNDEQFIEAARHLAQRALKEGGGEFIGRLNLMGRRLLAREFRPEEVKVAQASLDDLLAYYQSNPADAAQLLSVGESPADATLDAPTLAAWTMLANQLMNLDEVLNK
jgi:mono/diheme cytochrome c family protein